MKTTSFLLFIILISYVNLFSQKTVISAEQIILLKNEGFSDSTLNILVSAKKINISVEEMIKLKKTEISENLILKLALNENNVSDNFSTGELIEKAVMAWDSKDTLVVIDFLKRAVYHDPQNFTANFYLASMYKTIWDINNSIKYYEAVLSIQDHEISRFYLGIFYILNKQADKALIEFDKMKDSEDVKFFLNKILKPLKKYSIDIEGKNKVNFYDKKGNKKMAVRFLLNGVAYYDKNDKITEIKLYGFEKEVVGGYSPAFKQ